jgi:regulator of nonsense transcripts 1
LNALHSQSVDGAKVVIPDRLQNPPETQEPFILDLLTDAADKFSKKFCESLPVYELARDLPKGDAMQYIRQLLRGERHAFSEFEMFNMAVAIARKREIDLRPMLPHLDLSALTVEQKNIVSSTLALTPDEDRYVWNSLFWSDILTDRDLEQRNLKTKIPLQRFYSSNKSGLQSFWQYLKMGLQDFTRKVLILKVGCGYGKKSTSEIDEHRSTTALESGSSSEEKSLGTRTPQ